MTDVSHPNCWNLSTKEQGSFVSKHIRTYQYQWESSPHQTNSLGNMPTYPSSAEQQQRISMDFEITGHVSNPKFTTFQLLEPGINIFLSESGSRETCGCILTLSFISTASDHFLPFLSQSFSLFPSCPPFIFLSTMSHSKPFPATSSLICFVMTIPFPSRMVVLISVPPLSLLAGIAFISHCLHEILLVLKDLTEVSHFHCHHLYFPLCSSPNRTAFFSLVKDSIFKYWVFNISSCPAH